MKRIFLGIPISEEIRDKIKDFQTELSQFVGLKLVPPENLHFTLKFLGEVEEDKISEIRDSLHQVDWGNKFDLVVKMMGVFSNENYIKVIWLGVEDDSQLKSLFQKVEDQLGKQFPQDFEFTAHLTLARVKFVEDNKTTSRFKLSYSESKQKLLDFLERNKEVEVGESEVNKVILYESVLGTAGPEYSVLEEFNLD